MGAATGIALIERTLNTVPVAMFRFKAEMIRSYERAKGKSAEGDWSYHPAELTIIACGALTIIGFMLAVLGILAGDIRPGFALMMGSAFPVLLASHSRLARCAEDKGFAAGILETVLVLAERNAELAGLVAGRLKLNGNLAVSMPESFKEAQFSDQEMVKISGADFLVFCPDQECDDQNILEKSELLPFEFSMQAGRVEPISNHAWTEKTGLNRTVRQKWQKGQRKNQGMVSQTNRTWRTHRSRKFTSNANAIQSMGRTCERSLMRGRSARQKRACDQQHLILYSRQKARSTGGYRSKTTIRNRFGSNLAK